MRFAVLAVLLVCHMVHVTCAEDPPTKGLRLEDEDSAVRRTLPPAARTRAIDRNSWPLLCPVL